MKKTEKIREYRILAIDDEQDAVDLLELILFRENYIVEKACTANEAFKLLNNEKWKLPDLILLDIKMSGTDGLTFCQKLKQNPLFKYIPIIILSALTFSSDVERGFQCGAVDYIQKPWSNEDLLKRINQQIDLIDDVQN